MNGPLSSGDLQIFTLQVRNTLPYLADFQDEILVFHLEKPAENQETAQVLEDLVYLHQVGLRVILVHGQDEGFKFQNEDPSFRFSELQRPISWVNWEMQSRVLSLNRRLNVFSAHVIEAAPYSGEAENKDFFMGRVANVDVASIRDATESRKFIILPAFGIGEKGRLWFVDPFEVALEVAVRTRAK